MNEATPAVRPLPAAILALLLAAPPAAAAIEPGALELLGQAEIEPGRTFDETVLGGLSGITYDASRDRYYAVSDDPSSRSPARFYTLRLDLSSGALSDEGVTVESVTVLRTRSGQPFPHLVMDGEGITLTEDGTLLISSEGNVRERVPPSLWEFDLAGRQLRRLRVPRRYQPRRKRPFGVRHNMAFESMTRDASGRGFYTATENALRQDGPAADLERRSPARILRYDLASGRLTSELVYLVEPLVAPPVPADAFGTNGLVELLALGDGELLALERSYSQGVGNSIRLYAISTHGATNVRRAKRLGGRRAAGYLPVAKRLVLDLADLGLELDNVEGMTFGPPLPDGRRTLVLISDDNFASHQKTQILALAVGGPPPKTN